MQDFIQVIAGKRYQIKKKIGQGAFSSIYLGRDLKTELQVCIKIENNDQKEKFLTFEAKVYRILEGGVGFPNLYWTGLQGEFRLLVTDILGPSLQDLFNYCGKKFTLKTTLMLADQIFTRVEYLHEKQFVHRDIKPENFLVGLGARADKIYMIDFGASLQYKSAGDHIPPGRSDFALGSDKFRSVSSHMGITQGRKDDLQSIGYMLIYFLNGQLPWEQVFSFEKEERNLLIKERKVEMPLSLLCLNLPDQFRQYMEYIRSLEFQETPDYRWIRRLFKTLAERERIESDLIFDWAKRTSDVSRTGYVRTSTQKDTTFSDQSTWSHIIKK